MTPDNGKNIIRSLNPTLNYLRGTQFLNKIITVAKDGTGNYTTIYDAVNAGHEFILVKAGTYAETNDIILDGQVLIGESPKSTIIQLTNNSIEIKDNDATTAYSTGTAQVVNNSTTINGGGTSWDTGATAPSGYSDPWLSLRGMLLKISSITNDTTAVLERQHRGNTQTGNYVLFDAACHGSIFSGFQVEHTPTGATPCIKVSGINNIIENNTLLCDRLNTNYCIQMSPALSVSYGSKIRNNFIDSGAIGLILQAAQSCIIENNTFQNQNDHGIITDTGTDDAYGNKILNNSFFGITNTVIELDTASHHTTVSGNKMLYCPSTCFTADDCDYLIFTNNELDTNTGEAVLTYNTCQYGIFSDNVIVSGNVEVSATNFIFDGNRIEGTFIITGSQNSINNNRINNGNIQVTGNDTVISSNQTVSALADYAIRVNGDDCVISNNEFDLIANHGIQLDGGGSHTVTGNLLEDVGGNGIVVNAPDCNVTGNTIVAYNSNGGNNGIQITSTGDRSIVSHNIIRSADNSAPGINCDSDYIQIIGNKIIDTSGGNGITCTVGGTTNNENMMICGNHIQTVAIGIRLQTDGAAKVNDNWIQSPTSYGLHMTVGGNNISVNDNHFMACGNTAIFIDSNGRFSTINNNVIDTTTAGYGIHLSQGTSGGCNVISGNNVKDANSHGIFLDDEGTGTVNDENSVTGNVCFSNGGAGIQCETEKNVISSNICRSNADGIIMHTGDNNIICANSCEGNTTDGINVANTSDRIIITNNICLNNGGTQLVNNGTNTVAANNIVA